MEAVDGENEVGMETSRSQDALRRASEICGIPVQALRVAELPGVSAYFVAEPVRGGVRMTGGRTDVSRFADLRELNRKRYADVVDRDG